MALPRLTASDIEFAIPALEYVGDPLNGGQKLVFPCRLNGIQYALKVMLTTASSPSDPQHLDETTERATREVELMGQFDSPYLVKMGSIGLTVATIRGQQVVYFAEEWIEGTDVKTLIERNGPFSQEDVIQLGLDMTEGIDLLWTKDIVHRDIKPGNIMRRAPNGNFVLLDMGIALDLADISLTRTGNIAMTPAYASPEQLNLARKRELDCRSDLFALGLVLYEALTGKHPFLSRGVVAAPVTQLIQHVQVVPPSQIRPDVPKRLEMVICRMLEKKPHLRYKDCTTCRQALEKARAKGK
jgi:serine/threonine protein kinase